MCINIQAVLRDIEESFKAEYFCQYFNTGNELLDKDA